MKDRLILGLDLGQASDFTALAGVQPHDKDAKGRTVWALPLLKRWNLGTTYPSIVAEMATLCARLDKPTLVIDGTGVGRAVVDIFQDANLPVEDLIAVTITGGHSVNRVRCDAWNVPKKDLIGAAQSVIQSRRIKAARELKEFPTLLKELSTFKIKINTASMTESFEAWREQDHDDLVLATAMALWWGEMQGEQTLGDFVQVCAQPSPETIIAKLIPPPPADGPKYSNMRFFHQHNSYQPWIDRDGECLWLPDFRTEEIAGYALHLAHELLQLPQPPFARPVPGEQEGAPLTPADAAQAERVLRQFLRK